MADTPTDLERFVHLLWRPGDVREVRIPTPGRTDAGYFDSPDALVATVAPLDGRRNVYLTVNPVDPALLGRGNNRIVPRVRSTTADGQVTCRRWLPVDIDPRRPSDISASEGEREAALAVTRDVWRYLADRGWPEPVTAMSGNGYWLLYPVELPNDAASKAVVDGVLAHLAARFDSERVSIDTSVSNASRIVALIGTLKVKGDATADRPHRRSGLLRVPADLVPVPVELLAELAPPPSPAAAASGAIVVAGDRMPAGWVGTLLDAAGVAYRAGTRGQQTWYRLERCPFHPDDDQGGDCGVGEDEQGKALGHCFHNRGAGKGWREFRDALGLQRPAAAEPARPSRRVAAAPGIDAADLVALDLPPLRWIVPDLIPEGTVILAAAPKIGKSWLVYQIAVEASIGGDVLGRRVTPGSVLYYALEDGHRRGQDRLRAVLGGRTMPRGRLEVRWNAPAIGEGLEDDITEWLDGHRDAVMVAIDTLGKVRPATDSRKNAYEVDVAHLARLQDVFRDRQVALLLVHHVRKDATDDFLSSVSGTHGITGSVDTTIRIKRKRQEAFGSIEVTGRDIVETEVGVRFEGGRWTEAADVLSRASFERRQVYAVIEEQGPIFPTAIARHTGLIANSVQNMVSKLADEGAVVRVKGGYVVAKVEIASSPPGVPDVSPTHQTHQGGHHAYAGAREGEDRPALRVVPADPTAWARPCRSYREHQFEHRQRPSGWTCLTCYPEEGPIA